MAGKRRIVVTGAKGLIGSYLVEMGEAEWISVVRPSGHAVDGEVPIDLESSWDCTQTGLPEKCDAVIYLAQSSSYRELPEKSASLFQCNVVSAASMLRYAELAGARSFVYASTGSVYVNSEESRVITEGSPVISHPCDNSLYPWSKLTGETVVNSFSDRMAVTNLRFFFVYGKGGDRQMLLPRIARNVVEGNEVVVQGNSGLGVCPTYAGDAAEICLKATELEGTRTINVAGPETIGLKQIAEQIGEKAGKQPHLKCVQGKPPWFHVDVSRMVECLGRPPVSFADKAACLLE